MEDLEEITRRSIRKAIALDQLRYNGRNAKKHFLDDLDSSIFDTELRTFLQSYEWKFFKVDFPKTDLYFMKSNETDSKASQLKYFSGAFST